MKFEGKKSLNVVTERIDSKIHTLTCSQGSITVVSRVVLVVYECLCALIWSLSAPHSIKCMWECLCVFFNKRASQDHCGSDESNAP